MAAIAESNHVKTAPNSSRDAICLIKAIPLALRAFARRDSFVAGAVWRFRRAFLPFGQTITKPLTTPGASVRVVVVGSEDWCGRKRHAKRCQSEQRRADGSEKTRHGRLQF